MSIQDHEQLKELAGRQLTAVTFVWDYLQLQFDGPALNVMNTVAVSSQEQSARTGDNQFRNLLCSHISGRVQAVDINADEVSIEFFGGGRIAVLLADEHYSGPEAIYYYGFQNGGWGAIRPDFE
ncbi:hypothetical protein ISN76_19000 [Dyella halodurans]|uniref:Nuclear transport factor 2 family protein n=1 Tax=Dyella halodurans TaxID=1920171 RepID=A0ABV9C056_9GAMM|nr:hypothetical protein [Dyella halodurans]